MMSKEKVVTSIVLLFSLYFMLVGILLHFAIAIVITITYAIYKMRKL